MSELYTSLIRTKQELNGGILPPMTPVPENVQNFIDPRFTPGLGAIEASSERGLRCPVRGCGRWYDRLSTHLTTSHADIGGAEMVKRSLQIPQSAKLESAKIMEKFRARDVSYLRDWECSLNEQERATLRAKRSANVLRKATGHSRLPTGIRNLRNNCEAQIQQRILCVRDRVGRSPSQREADEYDFGLSGAARHLYGTWNGALAALNLKITPRGGPNWHSGKNRLRCEFVLDSLQAWVEVHGDLPTTYEAKGQNRMPLLPNYRAVMLALGTDQWPEAMRRAASALDLDSTRYPVPARHEAA